MGIEENIEDIRIIVNETRLSQIELHRKLNLLLNKEEPQDRTKIEKETKDALKLNDSAEVSTDLEA